MNQTRIRLPLRAGQAGLGWAGGAHVHGQLAALIGCGCPGAKARLQVVAQVGVACRQGRQNERGKEQGT